MITKKITFAAAALVATMSMVSAQSHVASWDFTSVNKLFGGLDTNGSATSDASDFLAADYEGSGTMEWSGLDTNASGFNTDIDVTANLTDDVLGGVSVLGDGFDFKVAAQDNAGSFSLTGLDFTGLTDATLSFGALVENNNGGVILNVGGLSSESITAVDTEFTVDISALNGLANQSIQFTFSDLTGTENFWIDNIQVTGTVVPEPSSFAALAGALALGFVAMRRRK